MRLRDVADVELGPESTDTIVSFNGKEGTFIGITPTPSANPLTVAEEVTKAIDGIRPTLPKGMTVEIVYDASNFISASIEEVFKTIGEAALIVVVVILLFLGSFRSVLIPIVTIPLSLVGVCFVLLRWATRSTCSLCWPWCSPSASWSTTPSWCWRTSTATSRRG